MEQKYKHLASQIEQTETAFASEPKHLIRNKPLERAKTQKTNTSRYSEPKRSIRNKYW